MANQVNTDYIELDPNGKIDLTVAVTRADFVGITFGELAYLVKDFGAGFWNNSSNFPHKNDIHITGKTGTETAQSLVTYALSKDLGGFSLGSAIESKVRVFKNSDRQDILLQAFIGGVNQVFDSVVFGVGINDYYLTHRFNPAIGTYGTFYTDVWSDSGRTVLEGTAEITLPEPLSYQYHYWIQTRDSGGTGTITCDVRNVDLNLVIASNRRKIVQQRMLNV